MNATQANTRVRVLHAHCIGGKPMNLGATYEIGAAVAAELVADGRVELCDPETKHIVRMAAAQAAGAAARNTRHGPSGVQY